MDGRQETVHALVLSGTIKPKVAVSKAKRASVGKVDDEIPDGVTRTGGSSSSKAAPKKMPFWKAFQYSYGSVEPKK